MIKPHLQFLFRVPAGWLMKTLEISAVAVFLMMGMYDPVSGETPSVHSYIKGDSLTVGDKFLLVNEIRADSGYIVKPAAVEGQLGDATVLSDIFRIPELDKNSEAYACTLAVYKPGDVVISPPGFIFTDSLGNTRFIHGDSVYAAVRSVLPADTSGIEIADIKEPLKLRGPIWPYLLIIPAIILIILIAIILRKYLGKGVQMPSAPPRPAWETAYERLDNLKNAKHLEFGRFKIFYFELSLIIRGYIESMYDFPAVESTTYELEVCGKLNVLDSDLHKNLFMLFSRADMTKFAKFQPTVEDCDSDFKFAYKFVDKTIPRIDTVETKKEETVEAA